MERIASGYRLAEAPVAIAGGGVAFSDVLGGGVRRWDPRTGEVEVVIPKRRGVGGMALHADGGLVVSGRDVSHVRDGKSRALYDPATDPGVTGLNDLTVTPDGRVVVGRLRFHPFAGEAPVPGEFVEVAADGTTTTVLEGVEWANGCAFSADGSTFYGCDYHRGVVLAAGRGADGDYGPGRVAVTSPTGAVDGMAVDEDGGLWVALGPSATVGRFTPDGRLDIEVEVPAAFVASLCFGGTDGRDLFVTTMEDPQGPGGDGAVFRTRAPVAGAPVAAVTG
ncbi:MAG: SMP-30/gluconolactonase/LRE family protein [Acidimicrobiia bacterium]|nr:SMP-30/gluconolactonase/LRE family protein [Acidimicrobiia bacterium]